MSMNYYKIVAQRLLHVLTGLPFTTISYFLVIFLLKLVMVFAATKICLNSLKIFQAILLLEILICQYRDQASQIKNSLTKTIEMHI